MMGNNQQAVLDDALAADSVERCHFRQAKSPAVDNKLSEPASVLWEQFFAYPAHVGRHIPVRIRHSWNTEGQRHRT